MTSTRRRRTSAESDTKSYVTGIDLELPFSFNGLLVCLADRLPVRR